MTQAKPPEGWNTINPEVAAIGSTIDRSFYFGMFFLLIGINSVLRHFCSFNVASLVTVFLFICGFLFLKTFLSKKKGQIVELQRYLSWVFATTKAEERIALIRSDPKLASYRKVVVSGVLLIVEIYGENGQPQHKLVVAVPKSPANLKETLNRTYTCKVHYDPETLEPVVIDFGAWRGWRLPAFRVA